MKCSSSEQTSLNWNSFCHDSNPNTALEHFFKIVQKLGKHDPYKNPKSQLGTKLRIIPGLANSIKIKNKLYKSFCKEKDSHKKRL